jgi:hypothetical protein
MCAGWAQRRQITYADLSEGQVINGFRAAAVYLDDAGRPIGARFKQVRSGFTLDLLGIQSVPQAFIWVTTYPTPTWASPTLRSICFSARATRVGLWAARNRCRWSAPARTRHC